MSEIIFLDAQDLRYEFSWDTPKAASNLTKHGILFHDAATAFLDRMALTKYDLAHSQYEERWLTIGHDRSGRVVVISHTWQTGDGAII